MAESNKDQSKPLAPLSLTTRSDDDIHFQNATKHINAQIHVHTRSKLILCCGFIASLTLLFAVTFIVLSVTVFHLRNPKLTVDSVSFIKSFDIANGEVNTNQNATVLVTVSLSNPNFASFKVRDVTVLVNYGGMGTVVGGGVKTSPEKVPAKRTAQMNLTAEIVTSKVVAFVPGLMEDLKGRGTELRISVGVNGKLKIVKIFKKSVHLKKECTMKLKMMMNNLTFEDMNCDKYAEI